MTDRISQIALKSFMGNLVDLEKKLMSLMQAAESLEAREVDGFKVLEIELQALKTMSSNSESELANLKGTLEVHMHDASVSQMQVVELTNRWNSESQALQTLVLNSMNDVRRKLETLVLGARSLQAKQAEELQDFAVKLTELELRVSELQGPTETSK